VRYPKQNEWLSPISLLSLSAFGTITPCGKKKKLYLPNYLVSDEEEKKGIREKANRKTQRSPELEIEFPF
jgi:hypothetical protein